MKSRITLTAALLVATLAPGVFGQKKQPKTRRPQPTHANLKYGKHERQAFDLYLAKSDKPAPLVVYYHGGGFRGGDKRSVNPALLKALLDKRVSVAAVNYRLTNVGPYPMQHLDCARALQTIRHEAAKYNIDSGRIGATGGSAGAGISMWLAFHKDLADHQSDDPIAHRSTRLSCAVVYGGQTSYDPRFIHKLFDTDKVHPALITLFGMKGPDDLSDPKLIKKFEDSSVINHLTKDDPPVLLYYSQANRPLPKNSSGGQHIHHPKFGFVFKKKADALGVTCVVKLREDYKNPSRSSAAVVRDQAQFFLKHLGVD